MSDAFDPKIIRKEFDAVGGDDLYTAAELQDGINRYRVENGPLWEKAKKHSQEEYGRIRWPFVMYLYQKMGGTK